ncbi:transporter substrate-binding domain-containing diguanylate cyclase [Aliikangiella sp. IMCC44359]|uniref:transporter substrate-binding domain-containing diguanylate cyclase n=1 Tax=Aliikangiella sp. IMCC44359 TaxID=3459125 RepID=UPI00403A803D
MAIFLCLLSNITVHARELGLSVSEQQYIEKAPTITLCTSNYDMPFEAYTNGSLIGITTNYATIISERSGLTIHPTPYTKETQQTQNNTKHQCDLVSTKTFNIEDSKDYMLTQAYLTSPLVFATTEEKRFINSIEQLKGKKVGFINQENYTKTLIDKFPYIDWVGVSSVEEGISLVAQGQLFSYAAPLASIGHYLQNNYHHGIKINGQYSEPLKLLFNINNDQPELKSIINKVINSIDRKLRLEINNSWIKVKYEHRANYELVLFVFLIGSAFFFGLLYRHITLRKHTTELQKISQTDKLTNLYNRVKTDEALIYHLNCFRRYGDTFSIILLDIDDFKKINDEQGHVAGDKVLVSVAETLNSNCRNTDIIGRWGGEEFLIICPKSSLEQTIQITEKLRANIELIPIDNHTDTNEPYKITASFGVTETQIEDTHNSLIIRADQALLQAKRKGKNQYVSAKSTLPNELMSEAS